MTTEETYKLMKNIALQKKNEQKQKIYSSQIKKKVSISLSLIGEGKV